MIVTLKPLIGKLRTSTKAILETAAGLCLARTHYDLAVEHFLVKLLETPDSDFQRIIRRFGVDQSRLSEELSRSLDKLKTGNARTPAIDTHLVDALIQGWVYGSIECGATSIRSGFVVVALLVDDNLVRILREISPELSKVDSEILRREFAEIVKGSAEDEPGASLRAAAPAAPAVPRGPRVFISYRHEDSKDYADYLYICFRAEAPDVNVFRDSNTLEPGMVFTEKIEETVAECDVLLALIGRKWLGADHKGARRIDDEDDWVRREVAAALRSKKRVIPCLVGGAKMPKKEELPPDLMDLAIRHGVTLSRSNLPRDAKDLLQTLVDGRRGR